MTTKRKTGPKQKFDLKTSAQLQAEIEDLKIELALRKLEEAAYEKIANEEVDEQCREAVKLKEQPRVEWHDLQSEQRCPSTRIPLRAMGVCAACLMLFLAGAGTGIAATNYLQRQTGIFAMNPGSESINFQFQMAQEPISVPVQWQGKYFPAYIPEGFTMKQIGNNRVYYENADGVRIVFQEKNMHDDVFINSENAIITHEKVGTRMATVSQMENATMIVFIDGDKLLKVSVTDIDFVGYKSRAEALKIAENIMMLK